MIDHTALQEQYRKENRLRSERLDERYDIRTGRFHYAPSDEPATWLCKHGPRGCDDCWGDEWMEKHFENKEQHGDTGQALQCECQIEAGERQGRGDWPYIIPTIEVGRKKR